jgi:diguanylate cyclase (GGDEF)-like protein
MRRGFWGRRIGLILVCTWSLQLHALALVGTPPHARYVPDLDVVPQNFGIAQDARGIVYVANVNGVLEFDGERWTLIPIDNREVVRSLAIDAGGRVFVGAYNAFGYLDHDAAGQAHYVDLTGRFREVLGDRDIADIWDIVIAPEGVYFRALRDVFFWDPLKDRVSHWHSEGRFGVVVSTPSGTLLQFRGEGLKRRHGQDWELLPETTVLVDLVNRLVPLADGGYLTVGVDGHWWRLFQDHLSAVNMPTGLPSSAAFNDAIALEDGSLAFVAGDGKVYIVDPQLRGQRYFQLDPGFLSGIYPAAGGGFLVAADQAIYRVAWPSTWTALNAEQGAEGSFFSLAAWAGDDYLMTSVGAWRLRPEIGQPPTFAKLPWSSSLSYALIAVDARRALLAESHPLILIDRDRRQQLGEELVYPRLFRRSDYRAGRIYVGTEAGLRFVDIDGEQITLSPAMSLGADVLVSSIVELSERELWFGSDHHGVWRVRLAEDGSIAEQQNLGAVTGLSLGVVPGASVSQLAGGELVASTANGFFRWTGEHFVPTDMDGLASLRHEEERLTLFSAGDGEVWAYGVSRLFRHQPQSGWSEQRLGQLRSGAYLQGTKLHDGSVAFVSDQSLLLHHPEARALQVRPPQILLRSVTRIQANGTRESLPIQTTQPVHLQFGDFGIQFQFALPDLANQRGRAYQGRLLGYETEFSEWSSSRGYQYSRLSPGAYTLQVRARDADGGISQIPDYALVIDPPWYRHWLAYALWTALALALAWCCVTFIIRRRVNKLALETTRLERMIDERTQDLAKANERLELMANVDGLTGIANRRRLDQYLIQVWEQGRERHRSMAVLVIDVDHFKRYNDTHGHLAGDRLLKSLVPLLTECLRRTEDLLARYGGEEFLVVMPGADAAAAMAVAQHMRAQIADAQLGSTISIGVASCVPGPGAVDDLVRRADQALYAAKRGGRNRVELDGAG